MVPALPWTVRPLVPQIAADNSSDSIDLAVPGSPTSSSARSPARVMTHLSTRDTSPTNFRLIFNLSLPQTKATTACGVSSQPGGRGPFSSASRANSSA